MSYAYAILSENGIPNRRGKAFNLPRTEDGKDAEPWHIFAVRWDKEVLGYVIAARMKGSISIGSATSLWSGERSALSAESTAPFSS